ncbi:hypothetical protein H312_03216 [Anncaliia algerae PRA339]|uniref:Uncharacterized protein n=1 Tax=Anncaliia algerae PRA339 TaxID=1288291 RepID=A0A059EXD2_9MICR|nr:hypothetical protein H312_03216 [Anncaliia algerae PRA339]
MKNEDLLSRILSKNAFDRLNRIKSLNSKEGDKIETLLINKFNMNRRIITDDEFIEILNENEKQKEKMQVIFKRRNRDDDLEDI